MQPLDYRSPDASTPEPKPVGKPIVITCVVFTAVALFTCGRIEILNRTAGVVLPRTEQGKWRTAYWTNERGWRSLESTVTGDASLATRRLTPAEQARMQKETSRQRANADLRDTVRTLGLLQYLLVPAVVFLSFALLTWQRGRRQRLIGLACLTTVLLCGGMTLYRGYFSSIMD